MNKFITLLILCSLISLKSYSQGTDSLIQSKTKEINIYLAKGAEARERLIIAKKINKLDSINLALKDSVILNLKLKDTLSTTDRKYLNSELTKTNKIYRREKFFRKLFQGTSIILTGYLLYKY